MRYQLGSGGAANSDSAQALLEIWAYEACRLFRDRLVGSKARDKFDSILSSVISSDWSTTTVVLNSEKEDKAMYVTWGLGRGGKDIAAQFGYPLGQLSHADLYEVVAKEVVAYGRSYANQ